MSTDQPAETAKSSKVVDCWNKAVASKIIADPAVIKLLILQNSINRLLYYAGHILRYESCLQTNYRSDMTAAAAVSQLTLHTCSTAAGSAGNLISAMYAQE